MNSLIARFNSLFAFTLMVMAALTLLVFLSTVFQQSRVPVNIRVANISLKQCEDYTGKYDLGSVHFSIYVAILFGLVTQIWYYLMLNDGQLGEKPNWFHALKPADDLEPVFNWNVKQLFLYLAAEYATKKNTLNQVVLWDKILQRGEDPRLNLQNVSPKYLFLDDGNGLKGNRNVSLSLSWNIVPNAGILYLIPASGQKVISLPENYDNLRSY